jgi:hypothetical protein
MLLMKLLKRVGRSRTVVFSGLPLLKYEPIVRVCHHFMSDLASDIHPYTIVDSANTEWAVVQIDFIT